MLNRISAAILAIGMITPDCCDKNREPIQYHAVLDYCKKNGWLPDSEPVSNSDMHIIGFVEKQNFHGLKKGVMRFRWERVLSKKILEPKKNHEYTYNLFYPKPENVAIIKDNKARTN